jgi:DNA-binding NtrC family response regulator
LSSGFIISAVRLRKLQEKERAEMRSRILFISGHPDDARRLSRMLQTLALWVDRVETLQQARAKLQQDDYCVILTEAALPDGIWQDALDLARQHPQDLEVIVTDLHADGRLWAEVLNQGGYDLLAQPFYEPEVRRILYNACARATCRAAAAG